MSIESLHLQSGSFEERLEKHGEDIQAWWDKVEKALGHNVDGLDYVEPTGEMFSGSTGSNTAGVSYIQPAIMPSKPSRLVPKRKKNRRAS